jgi:hypothetical protein
MYSRMAARAAAQVARCRLVALPGVGNKNAGVVMSQAFGVPMFPVDTHIHRLAHRWGLSKGRTPDGVSLDLRRVFPDASWYMPDLLLGGDEGAHRRGVPRARTQVALSRAGRPSGGDWSTSGALSFGSHRRFC